MAVGGFLLSDTSALYQSVSLGIVLRRSPGVTRWVPWTWTAVAVLPGAGPANWRLLRQDGDVREYHATTVDLTLYRGETEAYRVALSDRPPSLYVIMRTTQTGIEDCPLEVVLATASPHEAQLYAECGEELVEKIPMPPSLLAWVGDWIATHHEDQVFIKRRRDKAFKDLSQDGIGDPRIAKPSDIYASPTLQKRRLQ
jgi:hypothetical protein